MDNKNLESKVWFRLLKVIFIFIYIITISVVLVSAYPNKPYSANDTYNSIIMCDNGISYKAGDKGIDAEEAWAEQLGGTRVDLNGATPAKDMATNLCLGVPLNTVSNKLAPYLMEEHFKANFDAILSQASEQDAKEYADRYKSDGTGGYVLKTLYKVELIKKTVGSWWSFIGNIASSLFVVFIIFELIRRSFLYIAIGKKFFGRKI